MQNQIQNNKLQMLGKLSASLTHEIRNPLSAIRLNLDFMNMWAEEMSPEVKESIESCKEAVERISSLIESMLEFSRKPSNERAFHNINDIIEMGVGIMIPAAQMKSVHLITELHHNLPPVRFNKNKLLQVVINLITNALDASQKAGTVRVVSELENDQVVFSVCDNGCGIEDEDHEKIFTDFYTNKLNGTGLGLSVCKSIVEEHDGSISFFSVPGKGTTFIIKLPVFAGEKE